MKEINMMIMYHLVITSNSGFNFALVESVGSVRNFEPKSLFGKSVSLKFCDCDKEMADILNN